jgi:hypothetical protein
MSNLNIRLTTRSSTIVPPISETPKMVVWNANVDLVVPRIHVASVYFYRPTGDPNFFNGDVVREAIGKTLVPFFPMGGRLIRQEDGRIAINCEGQGVLFVEADADAYIDDFGDFACQPAMQQLVPKVEPTTDISSYPLLVLQVSWNDQSKIFQNIANSFDIGQFLTRELHVLVRCFMLIVFTVFVQPTLLCNNVVGGLPFEATSPVSILGVH